MNHGLVVKPIISDYFNSRGQIDLVDMHSLPDGEYNYILNYQDHLTKFVHLRPLKGKDGPGVARELYFIFGEFGAPMILQSDNGLEFRNQVVSSLKLLWPDLQIIHGRSRKPSTQGSVERSNGDFQNILGSWMRSNKTSNWVLGLPYVQYIKNRKFNKGIGTSAYAAVFGKDAYNGLELINLPDEQKNKIKCVKDLYEQLSGNLLYCYLLYSIIIHSTLLYYILDEKRKHITDLIIDECEEEEGGGLIKMNRKLRDIRDKKPDAGDDEDVLNLELESTFSKNEIVKMNESKTDKNLLNG